MSVPLLAAVNPIIGINEGTIRASIDSTIHSEIVLQKSKSSNMNKTAATFFCYLKGKERS
jgi:hypothetical protein